jgi:hypothetical protein
MIELCVVPAESGREAFEILLNSILDQIGMLSDAVAQQYFSHALVSREIGVMREEHSE